MPFPVPTCICGECLEKGYSIIINVKTLNITAESDLFKCQFPQFEISADLDSTYIRFFSLVYMDSAFNHFQ